MGYDVVFRVSHPTFSVFTLPYF